ncbi:glycosyltransferase family 1 protein [Clostridium perfringens]|uniref:glycosyltransferase family 1 protein n=1 Tax=Clostridium perfringens TaxID=1502 RepID=UPI001CAB47D5|nr:glycosyltransferase family 1 protein [Clostridium perfringens]STB61368.1 putative glycosyltransferase EpsF [Clostridium perfringens]
MKQLKVLTITTSGLIKKEGISTVILDNYSLFDKKKFNLNIIVSGNYDKNLVKDFRNAGVKPILFPDRKKELFKYIWNLYKIMKKENYDILYVHGSSAIMSIELIVALIVRCKLRIVHSHNTTCDHKFVDKLLRPIFYHLYTHAFACGHDAGKWLFSNRHFEIIKNGRSLSKYKYNLEVRNETRKFLQLKENIAVGHVGNFNNQKNHEFIIRMFKELVLLNDNAKLFLIGSGEKELEIRSLAEKMNLSENIIFMGNIDNVHEILQAMDVMILPSLYEGLPLVVVEWQLAALPSLISDSVTKECAFTDFIQFKSLGDGEQSWAEDIFKVCLKERAGLAKNVEKLAVESGYDLEKNAVDLQNRFLNYSKEILVKSK